MNGETITLIDSSNARFRNFVIEGNSIQDGEPTPEIPVEIESVGDNGNIEVNQRKNNLYDFRDLQGKSNEVVVDDDGWITINYDNSNGESTKFLNYYTNNLALNVNTEYSIVVEIKNISGTGTLYAYSQQDNLGQFLSSANLSFDKLSNGLVRICKGTTIGDFANSELGLRTFVGFNVGQRGSITFRLSVLKDTTVIPNTFTYEPYKGLTSTIPLSEPLRSLPNGKKDTIEKDGIHRRVGEIVLNGSENWNLDDVYEGIYEYSISIDDVVVNYSEDDVRVMSNYFKGVAWRDSWTKEDVVVSYMNRNSIRIMTKTHTSIDAFKNWLSTNNVTVQYELANEVIEPFTEEQQKAYDNIINNGTYKTTTNIYSSSEVAPTFKVEYSKDLETIVNNLG